MGVDPNKSTLEVWADKMNLIPDELPEDALPIAERNENIYWGNMMEDVLASEFGRRNKCRVIRPPTHLVHRKDSSGLDHSFRIQKPNICEFNKRMRANADRFLYGDREGRGNLQCKNTNFFLGIKWPDDKPLIHVSIQLQHELACSGAKWGAIAVLAGGNRYKQYIVERHDEVIKRISDEVEKFWGYVERKEEPPVVHHALDSESSMLALLHSNPVEDTVELDPILTVDAERLAFVKAQIKELKKEEKEISAVFKQAIGDHTLGMFPDGGVGETHSLTGFLWNSYEKRGSLTITAGEDDLSRIYEKLRDDGGADGQVKISLSKPVKVRTLRAHKSAIAKQRAKSK